MLQSLFPSNHNDSYRILTEQEKAQVTARIQNQMDYGNPNIVAAAKAFAARQSIISDISTNLGAFQYFRSFTQDLPPWR